LDGEEVNVLIQGEEYIFSYKVNIENIKNKIMCAMLLKNSQGINLGGGHYPKRNEYTVINKYEFVMRWHWKCNLVQGIFFINCGVSDENGFLHRIVDSYTIKVIENNIGVQSYQMVDFNIKAKYES